MSKKVNYTGVDFPPREIASELKTANDWAFYILNDFIKERENGLAEKNFYKLFLYVKELPKDYGVPEEMQPEVTESITNALKTLAQM